MSTYKVFYMVFYIYIYEHELPVRLIPLIQQFPCWVLVKVFHFRPLVFSFRTFLLSVVPLPGLENSVCNVLWGSTPLLLLLYACTYRIAPAVYR
jgi:hypothetical protein